MWLFSVKEVIDIQITRAHNCSTPPSCMLNGLVWGWGYCALSMRGGNKAWYEVLRIHEGKEDYHGQEGVSE